MAIDAAAPLRRAGVLTRPADFAHRHPDLLAATGLFALPFALLGRALLPGRVLSPADILLVFPPWSYVAPAWRMANPLLTDIAFMFHPWLIYVGRELRAGRLPLWNPHSFTGSPLFANPQTALLFPLTWLAVVLPPAVAITLISILKLSLAGLGMYWFLRVLALSPLAAAIGALAFMFNGGLVTWLQWAVGTGMMAVPFLFAGTERLRQRPGPRWIAGLALIVALAIFGGYLQITALALLAAGAWALGRARATERPRRFLTSWAAGVALGVLLAAVQLLPFLEYTSLSSVYYYRSQWMPIMAAPARAVIALLMPYYYGSPTGRDFWGYWNYNEIAAGVGLVPWVVLPAALLGAWPRAETRFFAALAVFSALMSYDTPGVTETFGGLFPFSLVITYRLVTFLAFALAALAAIGVDTLVTTGRTGAGRLTLGIRAAFVALVLLTLAIVVDDDPSLARAGLHVSITVQYAFFLGLLTLSALAALVLLGGRRSALVGTVLLAAELASVAPLAVTYNPIIESRLLYPTELPAIRWVQAATAGTPTRVMFGIGKNMGLIYGLDEATGYDGMTPRRIEQLVSPIAAGGSGGLLASGSINVTVNFASPVFDLLGVRYLVVPRDVVGLPAHFRLAFAGPDAWVLENPRALPRAFLVPHARWCVDDPTALRLMHDGRVDFAREVLLATCDHAPPTAAPAGAGRAEIRAHGTDYVLLHTEAEGPTYLVLTDTWFPGWQARVDGIEQPVWRADHAFRAVRLPAGVHDAEFAYRPASVHRGAWLSALGALGTCALLAWGWRCREA